MDMTKDNWTLDEIQRFVDLMTEDYLLTEQEIMDIIKKEEEEDNG
jgi:hypothetical protein